MSTPALLPLATLSPQLAAPAPALSRGAKAAQEFEAQLLGSLIESLEKTFAHVPGQADQPDQENYSYLGREALASALSANGGIGIAAMITKHLEKHESTHNDESAKRDRAETDAKVPGNSCR